MSVIGKRFRAHWSVLLALGATATAVQYHAGAAEASMPTQLIVHVDSLPVWGTDDAGLEYVESSPAILQSKSKRYIRRFGFARDYLPPAGLLPDGWSVDAPSPEGRANWFLGGTLDFTLRNTGRGKTATWRIQEPRVPILGRNPAGIRSAHILDERHIAFSVSDGSLVFFDRKSGAFVPRAVKASSRSPEEACRNAGFNFVIKCEGDMTGLFLSPGGDVLVRGRGETLHYAPLPDMPAKR